MRYALTIKLVTSLGDEKEKKAMTTALKKATLHSHYGAGDCVCVTDNMHLPVYTSSGSNVGRKKKKKRLFLLLSY